LTACNWRGEQYIAVGLGVHSFTGSNIGAMGLDRDDGLPYYVGYDAKIVSLVAEYNDMYALVQGSNPESTASVHKWTGSGWHWVWENESYPETPTRLFVSGARGAHRIWWGTGNNSWTLNLPIAYTNPRQVVVEGAPFTFAPVAYIQTGLTDMGMPGTKKIGVSIGIRAVSLDALVSTAPPEVKYRLNEADSFTTAIGPKDENGDTLITVNVADQTYFYWLDTGFEGIDFEEIELQVLWAYPILVKWAALYFTKVISGNRAWTVTLDLTEKFEDVSPELMEQAIDNYIIDENIIDFIYRDTTYKVRVTSWSGADSSGRADTRGMRTVQLIEVHDRP
jgi:hypothetical protein